MTIDCPSSVLDPSRRPAFVLLETVAYKAGATSRSIDEKSNAFFRNVQYTRGGSTTSHQPPPATTPVYNVLYQWMYLSHLTCVYSHF